jgi:hypothetical protein
MINKEFIRKQPDASNDYYKAYNIVQSLNKGEDKTVKIDNIIRFRKYLYDLAAKDQKIFRTLQNKNLLNVTVMRMK